MNCIQTKEGVGTGEKENRMVHSFILTVHARAADAMPLSTNREMPMNSNSINAAGNLMGPGMVRPIQQQVGQLTGQLWRIFHCPCFCVVMTKDQPGIRAV